MCPFHTIYDTSNPLIIAPDTISDVPVFIIQVILIMLNADVQSG